MSVWRRKSLYVSIGFSVLTSIYWASFSYFFPDFPLWTPALLVSCLFHLCCLMFFYRNPRVISTLIIINYCIIVLSPMSYGAIQRYGVFLALAHLSFSENTRRSLLAGTAILACEGACIFLFDVPVPQFLTSAACFELAFMAGLCARTIRQDKLIAANRHQLETYLNQHRIAQVLHDSATSELSAVILLCEQEKSASSDHSQIIESIHSQSLQALHNIQIIIRTLRDSCEDVSFIERNSSLNDCIEEGDKLLNIAGFHGRTRLSGKSPHVLSQRTEAIAAIALREIYSNILRHCPAYGNYTVNVNITSTSITITESNPYEQDSANRMTSGFGLQSLQMLVSNAGGTVDTSIANDLWAISVTIEN